MIAGVADTHTALWHLYDDGRLSVEAGNFIDQAAAGEDRSSSHPSAWRKLSTSSRKTACRQAPMRT